MSVPYLETNLSNGEFISSNNVVWQGPKIPCLELCPGDSITEVVFNIATKLCTLVDDIENLKSLDLTCIQGLCGENFKDFSLRSIIELLLNNDCNLKELIDSVASQVGTKTGLVLDIDMKCFKQDLIDICGVYPEILDINDILQILINRYCSSVTNINTIKTDIDELNAIITPILNPDPLSSCPVIQYQEPVVTLSPLNTGTPLLLHNHIEQITDPAIKELQNKLGTTAEFQSAVSSGCYNDYISANGIVQNPTNLYSALKNNDIIICDLLNRLDVIENSCLKPTCNDLKLGFVGSISSNILTLTFSHSNGTVIPLGFTDIGSDIIITDVLGNVISVNTASINQLITLGANITIPVGGLDTSDILSIQINSSFQSNIPGNTFNSPSILKCDNCFSGKIKNVTVGNITTCWSFQIPIVTTGASFKFAELLYRNGGVLNTLPLPTNNTNTGSFIASLPSNISLIGYNPNGSNYYELQLQFTNISSSIEPMIGLITTIGSIAYTENLYIKGQQC